MNYKANSSSGKPFFSVILSAIFVVQILAQSEPPKAEVRNVVDEYFGHKISDPYRWMEDLKADETQRWFKGQAEYAKNYFERLPARDEIFKELTAMSDTGSRFWDITPSRNLFFYKKLSPGEQDWKLYVREGLTGAERLLVDPTKITDGGQRFSMREWSLSWDGKYISYIIYAGGSGNGEMRVIETATGRDMGERIDRTLFSGAGSWLPDGKTFLYARRQKLAADAPATDRYKKVRIYRHTLGTDPDKDKAVFGFDVNPNVTFDHNMLPGVNTDRNSKYVFAFINSGSSPNYEIYAALLDELHQAQIPWRKIASLDDEVSDWKLHGDYLYLTTYKNAPRYKIVRINLLKPDMRSPELWFNGGDAIVENSAAQRDALYVQTRDGGLRKIYRVDHKTKRVEPLKLPYNGSAYIRASESSADGIYFSLVSWTRSGAHFKYDPKTGRATNTDLIPPSPVDMSNFEFVNAKARSYDGVMIPLVIIYKKGLKLDGHNPTLMNGYGAYGFENTRVSFYSPVLPWIDRGGVMVFAGVRGGGEYGEEWHLAGKGAKKPNTWKDFIACAEFLIAEKYTSPAHLGIEGGSAGGILISNAIAERPELFAAAIDRVGVNNPLRMETTPNGILNIPEFGSFKTEEGFKNLLAMDGYLKIKDGVKYPAVVLITGMNDPNVTPWMSAKMAARLQAASTSGKPVLLRVDYDAGHGGGTTTNQQNEESADTYAFLLQQLK